MKRSQLEFAVEGRRNNLLTDHVLSRSLFSFVFRCFGSGCWMPAIVRTRSAFRLSHLYNIIIKALLTTEVGVVDNINVFHAVGVGLFRRDD